MTNKVSEPALSSRIREWESTLGGRTELGMYVCLSPYPRARLFGERLGALARSRRKETKGELALEAL